MILIIGNSTAYAVAAFDAVRVALEQRGKSCILFKQDKCLEGETLRFDIDEGETRFSAVIDSTEYDIESFSGIWYLKPLLPKSLRMLEPVEYRPFVQKQFYEMREALWFLFAHKRSLNDPWMCRRAENKMLQLHMAVRAGFCVPETTITSDPSSVRAFYAKHRSGIIVKTLASVPMNDKVIFTNRVGENEMRQIEQVRMSPSIFQQWLAKAYELRITVVGTKMFAARIDAQDDPETALDWRRKPKVNDSGVKMTPVEISTKMQETINEFMQSMHLRFGCIDMIVTPEGKEFFLEINPNGQWYFIQLQTEMQIADAIADLLI